jgi:cyd operon protein YbgT
MVGRKFGMPLFVLIRVGAFAGIHAEPTSKETAMWYFTWILGIGFALGFGIINVMWLEANDTFASQRGEAGAAPPGASKDTDS